MHNEPRHAHLDDEDIVASLRRAVDALEPDPVRPPWRQGRRRRLQRVAAAGVGAVVAASITVGAAIVSMGGVDRSATPIGATEPAGEVGIERSVAEACRGARFVEAFDFIVDNGTGAPTPRAAVKALMKEHDYPGSELVEGPRSQSTATFYLLDAEGAAKTEVTANRFSSGWFVTHQLQCVRQAS